VRPPPEIRRLAEQRSTARADRDFAEADRLRDELDAAGWQVLDTSAGYVLRPRPAYDVFTDVSSLPDRAGTPPTRRASVALLVEGWPDDLRGAVDALVEHAPGDVNVVGLDVGNVEGAGDALHQLATAYPGRVEEWHVAAHPGWGAARRALLRAEPAEVHVLMETSTVLDGDALSPLLAAVAEPGVVGAGWKGADVDRDSGWREFRDAGPGEVDALLGYLLAVRRDAALAADVPDVRARFYRNADLEMSLALRECGGRLVVPAADLPVHQERHRGYHDTDPAARDRESRRTYDRLLARFRGRDDILAPRA
jgi:hypothetical protein